MKHNSFQSYTCRIALLFLLVFSFSCQKENDRATPTQPNTPSILNADGSNLLLSAPLLSQTRTATFLNNHNNFRQVFGNQGYPKAKAEDVAVDDNVYGYSSKLVASNDSAGPFHANSASSLALQGFGFTVPENAVIENIILRIRRFKNGRPPVGDFTLSLMQRYQCGVGQPCTYGVFWTFRDTYAGKIYPDTETEYVFSQIGSGNKGGFYHDEPYQWTPAIVNHTFFGVRIDTYPPIGRGGVVVYYDLVEVTIEYSMPI